MHNIPREVQTLRFYRSSRSVVNKYVRPSNTRTEMYAGRVACCPLVNHVEYAPGAVS